jgi:hypothetical protein
MVANYHGLIFTNHALSRMRERKIKQGDVWATWKRPDNSRYAKSKSAWVYYKTYGNQKIEVVAKQNEKKQWIVLSVWSRSILSKKRKKTSSLLPFSFRKFLFKTILGKR